MVAHQAKYELMWLRRCGLDLAKVITFDTKIAEYVLMGNLAAGDKNMPPRSTSLDACCRRRGLQAKDPVVNIMMSHGINPVNMPRPWLQGRCERDVEETEKVFLDQREQLKKTNRLPVLFTRCILTPVLADTEFNGMALDKARVYKEYEQHVKRKNELSNRMDELTGGINWNSSKQVGEFLYDVLKFDELRNKRGEPKRTAAGKRLTDKNSLKKLKATTSKQKEFLKIKAELGKVSAALSKSLEFFKGVVDEYGEVFHAEFNQTVTATHRLSSSGIRMTFEQFDKPKQAQFQNLPNAFKTLFRAKRPGWKIGEVDGSQLEFRVAGHLGKDSQILKDIVNKHDVHRFTASVLNNITEAEVTKEQRKKAKADTFKPMYGGQSGTDAQRAYYSAYKERYSELNATQESWVREVLNRKRLITSWGLRYYWPYARRSSSGYVNVTSAVYNYQIQALATAEIIPIAITYFWHRVRAEGLEDKIVLVNTVHDSGICEVHPDHQDDFRRIAIRAFGEDVYNYLKNVYGIEFTIPLGAGIMLSDHWDDDTEGEEESYDIYIDGRVEKI
jgi:DNA polymerase I-like protein with 3'-5' exonuclease and polymerase domains